MISFAVMKTTEICISDYTYELPDERIAKYPLPERSHSKLLFYNRGGISDHLFVDLPDLLPSDAILVRNNTKVIRARLLFRKNGDGARIEVFCLEPHLPAGYDTNLTTTETCSWICMIGNAKKWRGAPLECQIQHRDGSQVTLRAERTGEREGEGEIVRFSWDNPQLCFGDLLELCGVLPIPPYLHRETEEQDLQTYQTVYAQAKGSVAAPTAGLHFTPKVFTDLARKQIPVLDLTLHVGAGTFRPVKTATIGEHHMHRELVVASQSLIKELATTARKPIAVGTTSVRSLESLYYLAVLIAENPSIPVSELQVEQWSPYIRSTSLPNRTEAFATLLRYMERNELEQLIFPTGILIAPGYTYRVVEGILTNFHQPQSTLILLVAAFVGEQWRDIYRHALDKDYRFLSYGDSSLLLR